MNIVTLKGKEKMVKELKRLTNVERPIVIKAIEEARAHGDLSENAEYAAAKERQSFIEGRIAELSSKISSVQVIDPSTIKDDKVVFGATVTVENSDTNEKIMYQIVGEDEADVSAGSISIMSPIARALIGKKQGDVVAVRTPKGETEYEILKIDYV
ncbi:MAG: transcription elongation factor GreA [Pseudomonadota bacterium]